MRPIPKKMLREILEDPHYHGCARSDISCKGRITLEHAIIFRGRQLNEKWAIIPLCAFHHSVDQFQDGPGLNKEINIMIALNRATNEELFAISKVIDYIWMRDVLNGKYNTNRIFSPIAIKSQEIKL